MENAKLNVGVDIKKIQETLNKITNRAGSSSQLGNANIYNVDDIITNTTSNKVNASSA